MFSESISEDGLEIAKFNGSFWLKLFYHNCDGNVKFKDEKEALHCNSEQKYSILSNINPSMRINGKYEFILEYPGDVYYRWRQTRSPINEYESASQREALGFEPIHQGSGKLNISGLVRTTIKVADKYINCLFDGQPGVSLWYFAIGVYEATEPAYLTKDIPAYSNTVKSVKLWIRINPKGNYRLCTCAVYRKLPISYLFYLILSICK